MQITWDAFLATVMWQTKNINLAKLSFLVCLTAMSGIMTLHLDGFVVLYLRSNR